MENLKLNFDKESFDNFIDLGKGICFIAQKKSVNTSILTGQKIEIFETNKLQSKITAKVISSYTFSSFNYFLSQAKNLFKDDLLYDIFRYMIPDSTLEYNMNVKSLIKYLNKYPSLRKITKGISVDQNFFVVLFQVLESKISYVEKQPNLTSDLDIANKIVEDIVKLYSDKFSIVNVCNDVNIIYSSSISQKTSTQRIDLKFATIWKDVFKFAPVLESNVNVNLIDITKVSDDKLLDDPFLVQMFTPKDLKAFESFKKEKIRIRYAYSTLGYKLVNKFNLIMGRLNSEVTPVYQMNYLSILLVLSNMYININPELQDIYIYPLRLLHTWMFQNNSEFKSPILSAGDKVLDFGFDSHFQKRVSVVMNSMVNVILNHEIYMSSKFDLKSIFTSTVLGTFSDPFNFPKKIKEPINFLILNMSANPEKIREPVLMKSFVPMSSLKHRHPLYPIPDNISTSQYIHYTSPLLCQGCDRHQLATDLYRNLVSKKYKLMRDKVKSDVESIYLLPLFDLFESDIATEEPIVLSLFINSLLGLAGFTSTNHLIDVSNTIDSSLEHIQQYLKSDRFTSDVAKQFRNNLCVKGSQITQLSYDAGLYIHPKQFKQNTINFMTSRSAGVGSYKLKLVYDDNVISINRTDKLFAFAQEGDNLFLLTDSLQHTEKWKTWAQRIQSRYDHIDVDKILDPRSYRGPAYQFADDKCIQFQIGRRLVPGPKNVRAVYIVPLSYYLMESELFRFVDLNNKVEKQPVFSKFISQFDKGNANGKNKISNNDDYISGVVMGTTWKDYFLYFIDYSKFDTTQSWEGALQYFMNGVANKLVEFSDPIFSETCFTVDGKNLCLKELIYYYIGLNKNKIYMLKGVTGIREFTVPFMSSGAKYTFDLNSIVNETVTELIEKAAVELNIGFIEFLCLIILGDDNAGLFKVTSMKYSALDMVMKLLAEYPSLCGLIVNVDKSGLSDISVEIAKVLAYRGYVGRLGLMQVFEVEQPSNASTKVEQMRGFSTKLLTFYHRFALNAQNFRILNMTLSTLGNMYDLKPLQGYRSTKLINSVYASIAPSSLPGGLGTTISGMGNNEVLWLNVIYPEILLKSVISANLIDFKPFQDFKDQITKDIINQNENVEVINPSGVKQKTTLKQGAASSSPSSLAIKTSQLADIELKKIGLKIPNKITVVGFMDAMNESIIESLKIPASVVLKRFGSMINVKPIHDENSMKLNARKYLDQNYPLTAATAFMLKRLTWDSIESSLSVTRYPTAEIGLRLVTSMFGCLSEKNAINSSSVLRLMNNIINHVKTFGFVSPSLTAENLSDIIFETISKISTPKGKSVMDIHLALTKLFERLFGNVPNLLPFITEAITLAPLIAESQYGFSYLGSYLSYCNTDINSTSYFVKNCIAPMKFYTTLIYQASCYIVAAYIAFFNEPFLISSRICDVRIMDKYKMFYMSLPTLFKSDDPLIGYNTDFSSN